MHIFHHGSCALLAFCLLIGGFPKQILVSYCIRNNDSNDFAIVCVSELRRSLSPLSRNYATGQHDWHGHRKMYRDFLEYSIARLRYRQKAHRVILIIIWTVQQVAVYYFHTFSSNHSSQLFARFTRRFVSVFQIAI